MDGKALASAWIPPIGMATVAACSRGKAELPLVPAAAAHRPQVMSCNELGWENLSAKKTPVIVLVASSTGDGDPPDNAAKFYVTMKCVLDCSISCRLVRE